MWRGPFIDQTNVRVVPGSALIAKVMLFERPKDLREFWRRRTGFDISSKCLGAVSALSRERVHPGHVLEVDRRFFCMIGLTAGNLSMEIISHEAVHAGFAFARRRARAPWSDESLRLDEEAVAYPAGRVAAMINRWLHDRGHYARWG